MKISNDSDGPIKVAIIYRHGVILSCVYVIIITTSLSSVHSGVSSFISIIVFYFSSESDGKRDYGSIKRKCVGHLYLYCY